jgi:valyl-tRNA synthetase
MPKQLEKRYDHKSVEDRIYAEWLDKGYFHAEPDESKTPFTIVIPPPNVTGRLHMGHALDNALQDALIRFKRMRGFNALWIPGTDHASISTETKIVAQMAEEGLTKADAGRDGFMERAWAWKEEYGGTIIAQLKKLGASCDWERERFTMDEGLSTAVLTVFERLYNKGLIYRGERIINWCPKCRTTISEAEVEHKDSDSCFWILKYPINERPGKYIQFATTRPETMLGDTAIAVHPGDGRYADLVGKTVTVPVVDRIIPIIADEYVDMDFGVGVVKITPAHDPNDFEVGERHNLPKINIMNDDGTLNGNAGRYAGLDRFAARERIVDEFKRLGLFVKVERRGNAVGVHDRCGAIVEPLIKLQWFVKMEELAKPAIEAYKSGELRFIPDRFGKIYLHWLENIRDWCVSRQLWWGHRVPAYYCQSCGAVEVSRENVALCPKCGAGMVQDEDSLDTWFSSALWPFSTLGWPEDTPEFRYFYPTNVLVTAYDIIFFWVVRMVFSGLEHTGKAPFNDVLIHGLVRDSQGRKMSKSLGNGIDPLEIIDEYGADALRLMLTTGTAPGADMRFTRERLEASRNFLNKLWNAARFILMNMDAALPGDMPDTLTSADKWILSRANVLNRDATLNIENYDLCLAAQKVYDFVWDEFCDWYIEMVKPRLYNAEDKTRGAALWTLREVMVNSLKLLHPFIPFITEEIFAAVQSAEPTIMRSPWPVYGDGRDFSDDERDIEIIKEAVKGIRNVRSDMNVPPSKRTLVYAVSDDAEMRAVFQRGRAYAASLGYASEFIVTDNKDGISDNAVSVPLGKAAVYIPLEQLVDIGKTAERLAKEMAKIEKEISLAEGKLNNEGFMAKAPAPLVAAEREKLKKFQLMKRQTEERIASLGV